MKKMKLILSAAIALLFIACDGPQGPPGFDGFDGEDGQDAPLASVFEENVSFSFIADENTWVSDTLSFDGTVDGDIFMVFISFGNDLFTPLPASVFDEFGEFQYVFDHDVTTVELQIIGDNDLSTLDPTSTQNIPTRVAIIPAELIGEFSSNDLMSLDTIMSLSGLNESDITGL